MKVKVINRSVSEFTRETNQDIHRIKRNYDSNLHPFQFEREYKRALNAVKLDKIFAKPFLASLSGHQESVQCLLKHPNSLSTLISGSCDGKIKIWNLINKKCIRTLDAHQGIVQSLCTSNQAKHFFSIGDNNIKQWKLTKANNLDDLIDEQKELNDSNEDEDILMPLNTIISKHLLLQSDHHWNKPLIMTCGEVCELWEENRSTPLTTFEWGVDTIYNVKFNPIETDLCASAVSDRGIVLYDIRKSQPLKKVILKMRTNSICWNPMESFIFTAANEDHDLHTFDMRNLSKPLIIHKDHVSAVIDVDYAPTGKEFVSGGYDKTLRIFPVDGSRSREVYHTKRMQRLNSVVWTTDNNYVISASNEFDIRIWKARASEKLGTVSRREKMNFRYQDKLKEKFSEYPEIKRIATHRHVPRHIYVQRKEKQSIIASMKKKERNVRAHTKPDKLLPIEEERKKPIVKEDDF